MPNLSKKRDGSAWRVHVDGRPTSILIDKGPPAKWGHGQTYDVVDADADSYLFEARGVANAMATLERISKIVSLKE